MLINLITKVQAAEIDFRGTATNEVLAGSETSFIEFLGRILGAIMIIASLMLLLYLLWGGISWISAGGDASKIQKARDQMTQAVIGIIVLSSTLAIFMLVQNFLGIKLVEFSGGNQTSVGSTTQTTNPGGLSAVAKQIGGWRDSLVDSLRNIGNRLTNR